MPASPRRVALPRSIHAPSEDFCLDFANTLAWRGSPAPVEALGEPTDLLEWLARADRGAASDYAALAGWLRNRPARAASVFAEALALRETIYRCCLAVASGESVANADLDRLNRALAAAPPRRRVVREGQTGAIRDGQARMPGGGPGYAWAVAPAAPPAPMLLAPVLWSAADLLTRGGALRVRCCANDQCRWLFIDRSKAGTRRWCDMAACGNRAKAQRHYRKSRSG